ncbi:MAG: glycoside hydrolase family 9 protein, partial [Fibrobacter sp.]|nr:glycoside hydrolase family 9 protein [Fibrobacter sp.]
MGVKRNLIVFMVLVVVGSVFSQYVTDPLPYAKIANPLPDTMDQLYRDSFNLEFSPIRLNQAGYRPQDRKFFYYVGSSASSFTVIDEKGNEVGSGTLKSTGEKTSAQLNIRASNNATLVSGGDTRYTMKSETFSGTIFEGEITDELPPGEYRIVVGSETSHPFVVDEKLYSWVRDALLKFYGVNRCGDSQSWFHPGCHLKDEVTGGWHDCGDHLKEGATMSYTAAVLGLAAAVFTDRDDDVYSANQGITQVTDGIPDILYEAKHGADFVLRSYENAKGIVGDMITSIGGFGNPGCGDDHSWWGRPEYQDKMPTARGGAPRCARNEVGPDYLGRYAANLAFVSKKFRPYDEAYADKCIEAAKAIYEYAKLLPMKATNTSAYNGETIVADDVAFACMAILWATGERKYLDELCFDKTIGVKANANAGQMRGYFEGGWFTNNREAFSKAGTNTDWGSVQAHTLWGFFRLVLQDTVLCEDLGLSEEERLALIEKTMDNFTSNITDIGQQGQSIPLPGGMQWLREPVIQYSLPWFEMFTPM